MKILYLSSLVSESYFEKLFKEEKTTGYTGQKYHGMFVKGLAEHLCDGTITVLSQPPTNSASLLLREKQGRVTFRYVPIIPVIIVKQLFSAIYRILYTLWWCLKNICQKKIVICSLMRIYQYVPLIPILKLFCCKTVTVACDIPWMTISQAHVGKLTRKQKLVMYLSKIICSKFDSYVLLTESMNEVINQKNKPYVVVEGFCDMSMKDKINTIENKYAQNVIIYAGGLNSKYGLCNLIDAVSKIDNVELWLYGKGDVSELYANCCPSNVIFLGPRRNSEVVNSEIKAIALINPRPTTGEYTRFSFPSKTLEYMASGTYTMTTELDGIPDEYFDYCYTIKDYDSSGLEKAIRDVLSLDRAELCKMGNDAKLFVLNNKNNVIQTKKIVELITKL